MRSYAEIMAGARDQSPFSNHTEWEIWSARWCERCANDTPEKVDRGEGCPLILAALMRKTPAEWLDDDEHTHTYRCIEFRHQGDGPDPEPQPIPDPPGQGTLLPREPYEGPRMYAGVRPAEVRTP